MSKCIIDDFYKSRDERVYEECAPSLRANRTGLKVNDKDNYMYEYRIRKLTPRECFRLMGFAVRRDDGTFDDEYFERAEKANSDTQLYKQAGNSIVVNCIEEILRSLFKKEN